MAVSLPCRYIHSQTGLISKEDLASSLDIVKEMAMYGGDISKFVPENVIKPIYDKYNIQRNKEGENHEQN